MPESTLDIVTISTRNPANDGGDTIVFAAVDVVNGHKYRATGRETLLAYNEHETDTFTVTITSAPDALGRTEDVERDIDAGEYVAWELGLLGWRQETGDDNQGYVLVTADSESVLLAVIRRPAR